MRNFRFILLYLLAAGMPGSSWAQLDLPTPSPFQSVTQDFGLGEIKIEYSRPGVKGRVIYGGLVPYDQIWRTGANASTKITFGENVRIDGKDVEPGTYAMYTIPGKETWHVMLYKDLKLGGRVASYKEEDEYMRFSIKPGRLSGKLETFTIAVNNMTYTSCTIDLMWEHTIISLPVQSMHDKAVMKQIADIMPDTVDNRPYFRAAFYYYENDKDLKQALSWVNKAIAQDPKAFWVIHVKAKIQHKLKDYKGAIATAGKSKTVAAERENSHYVTLNEELIAEVKKESGMK